MTDLPLSQTKRRRQPPQRGGNDRSSVNAKFWPVNDQHTSSSSTSVSSTSKSDSDSEYAIHEGTDGHSSSASMRTVTTTTTAAFSKNATHHQSAPFQPWSPEKSSRAILKKQQELNDLIHHLQLPSTNIRPATHGQKPTSGTGKRQGNPSPSRARSSGPAYATSPSVGLYPILSPPRKHSAPSVQSELFPPYGHHDNEPKSNYNAPVVSDLIEKRRHSKANSRASESADQSKMILEDLFSVSQQLKIRKQTLAERAADLVRREKLLQAKETGITSLIEERVSDQVAQKELDWRSASEQVLSKYEATLADLAKESGRLQASLKEMVGNNRQLRESNKRLQEELKLRDAKISESQSQIKSGQERQERLRFQLLQSQTLASSSEERCKVTEQKLASLKLEREKERNQIQNLQQEIDDERKKAESIISMAPLKRDAGTQENLFLDQDSSSLPILSPDHVQLYIYFLKLQKHALAQGLLLPHRESDGKPSIDNKTVVNTLTSMLPSSVWSAEVSRLFLEFALQHIQFNANSSAEKYALGQVAYKHYTQHQVTLSPFPVHRLLLGLIIFCGITQLDALEAVMKSIHDLLMEDSRLVSFFIYYLGPSIVCHFLEYPSTRLIACKILLLAASAPSPPPTSESSVGRDVLTGVEGMNLEHLDEDEFIRQCSFSSVLDSLKVCVDAVVQESLISEDVTVGQQIMDIISVLVQKLSKWSANEDLLRTHGLVELLCGLVGLTRGKGDTRENDNPPALHSIPPSLKSVITSDFCVLNIQSVLLNLGLEWDRSGQNSRILTELEAMKDLKLPPGVYENHFGRVGYLTAQQEATLTTFKQELAAEQNYDPAKHDDYILLRFLRARKFDIPKSKKMWIDYLEWRTRERIDFIKQEFDFPEYAIISKFYPRYYHKTDVLGRPIYIEQLGAFDARKMLAVCSAETLIRNHVYEYEKLVNYRLVACSAKSGRHMEQSCTILDLKGVPLSQFSSVFSLVKQISAVAQEYYPEMLGRMYIINAPMLFTAVWNVIKGFLDEVTVKKISIHGSNYKSYLLESIAPENLPTSLGGACQCVGGCENLQPGPWADSSLPGFPDAEWEKIRMKYGGLFLDPYRVEGVEPFKMVSRQPSFAVGGSTSATGTTPSSPK